MGLAFWLACLLVATASAQTVGRNVNMVAGTQWPGGDPFLQRQNEPSIAVSTRNPMHLVAGANDYRTVDLPGLPEGRVIGDAWLGLFKSFDGGRRWQSTLLPGYPQDTSAAGSISPLKGFEAGADPVVRAGSNGLFYYSGIVFDRAERGRGAVFVARFMDLNNKEGAEFDIASNSDPIKYVSTVVIDQGNAGQFLDKPWIAVDIPRGTRHTCTLDVPESVNDLNKTTRQVVPAGNVYIAYSSFASGERVPRARVLFSRSTDCGATWSKPIKLSESIPISQGTVVAIDPTTGHVYVAWRQFARFDDEGNQLNPNAIWIARSIDGGKSFGKAVQVAVINPFDQGTSIVSFRTNAFPTLAHDGLQAYLAWSERGRGPEGDARIVFTSSSDGFRWTPPVAVDNPPVRGHQLMPSLTFASGRLMLLYYDLRIDHTIGILEPMDPLAGVGAGFVENREPAGDLAPPSPEPEKVFNQFIADAPPPGFGPLERRHTIDVRVAQADSGPMPAFGPSVLVSQYVFGSRPGSVVIEQFQFNPPNFPMFRQGTAAFMGDYVDLRGLDMVPTPSGGWTFNTQPAPSPVFHAVWTDNRDVRPPADGDWTRYTPPGSSGGSSLFDPAQTAPQCVVGQSGSRNQNIYTSRITGGLFAAALQNSKQLGFRELPDGSLILFQRAFAIVVQNGTNEIRTYRLTIANQPPGGEASFLQFAVTGQPFPFTELDVQIAPLSTISRTVFVRSSDPHARVEILVREITAPGGFLIPPDAGGLQETVVLNPDISNPDISNPDISNPDISNAEVYNPDISNPDISNPDISNPDISNPDISNPDISNVELANPDIANPDISNPDISNPDISNPDISNPDISNPDISNGTITDVTWTVTNNGNTAASFNINLLASKGLPPGFKSQLVMYRTYTTPVSLNCELMVQTQNVLVANILNPTFDSMSDPSAPDISNPDISNATLSLMPGESAKITLRVVDPNRFDDMTFDPEQDIAPEAEAQAVNTEDAPEDPTIEQDPEDENFPTPPSTSALVIGTSSLADGVVSAPYSQTLEATGGTPPYTWSVTGDLPAGLALNPSTGEISGTPTAAGTFNFTAEVFDSSSPARTNSKFLSLRVAEPLVITTTSLADATQNSFYTALLQASGGSAPVSWFVSGGALPAGVSLNASTGELSGTPTVFGTFNFTVTAVDSSSPAQMAMQALSLLVAESATPGMIVTFLVQPSTSTAGSVISPPVRVQVIDSFGAVVPGANVDMTIGFDPTSGSGVLAGTTMVLTDALGQATFSDLSLTPAGNGYRLRASVSAGGFLPAQADSAAFDVVPPTMPGTEHLLLADRTPSLVRRFDLNVDTELSASTRTGTNPDDVAVSPNGRLAFVANLNSNFISLLDLTLNTELARLRSLRAFHAQLTADGARLVVPMVARPNSDEVVIVDTATLDEQRISLNGLVGDDPDFGSDITLGALVVVGNRTFIEGLNSAVPIIILNLDTATVSTIPGTDSSSGFVPSQGTPSLAATPDGSLVVAVRASPNNLLIIDTTSGSESVLQTVALGSFPRAVAVTRDAADPDGVFAFVLRSPNIISAVSLNPGPTFGTIVSEVTLPVEMGNVTFGLGVLALTADSNRAFVINGSPASTHNLAVVDIVGGGPTFSVVKSLRVGSELRDVTVAPTLLASPPGAPTVTDVSPSQVVNTSDTVIEITGSGFDPDAHVRLGNLDPVPATFLSSSLLQVTLPALSAAQRADVLVINPNSTGSQSDQFLSGRLADALEISSSSAFRPRHQVAVVNFGESTVSVLNAAVNDTLHATNPETELLGVTFTPDAARAYVGQFSDPGAVRGFNLLTGALEATIPVSTNTIGQSQGVASALHPTLGTPVVYVVSGIPLGGGMGFDEQLSVIDADPTSSNFNTVIQTIAAGLTGGAGNRGGLAVTPDGRYVYHNGFVSGDGRIVIFDVVTETATAVLTSSLGVGTFQPFVRLSPDGQSLLLRDNDGAVRVFDIGADPFNPTLVATIVGTPPMGFDSVFFCDFQVVDNHLFADDCGPHLVQVFNFDRSTPDFSQIASFDAPGLDGFFFSGITVTPDGGHLYIVLDQEDSIAVLDTAQLISAGPGVLLTKIRVGLNASTLAARPGTPTPGGSDVTVQMTQDVSVIFSSVTGSGETSVAVSGAHPIALPSGFNPGLPPLFYEVNTTAAFSGTLQVCITYVEGQFSTAEGSLRILHQEGAVWVDRTFSLDTANNVICARVTSLSAFVVGGP